jgi:hypothetical protein
MAANEFEKNVRKEMAEFKLQPSGDVWLKVEERLHEKKRKRRVIFFILFSSIALLVAGYGIYHFSAKNPKPGITNKLSGQVGTAVNSTKEKQNDVAIEPNSRQEKKVQNKTHAAEKVKDVPDHKRQENETKKLSTAQNNFHITPVKKIERTADLKQTEMLKADNNKNVAIESDNEKPSAEQNKNVNDTIQKTVAKQIEINAVTHLADTAGSTSKEPQNEVAASEHKNVPEKKKDSKKITWGIDISFGSSTITEDRFSFDNSKSLADMQYGTPGNSTGGQPGNYHGPQSQNKSSFAFKTGVTARKNISPRSSLSVGIAYSYLADKITVGAKQYSNQYQNNSVAPYYMNVSSQQSSSSQQTYTDQFHFIELPVIYHWRMTKNRGHFLSLDAGISPSYLLASNALVYDTTLGGIYYSDKSLIQKAHFNIVSGLSYQFGINKNVRFSLGPQVSFDLTKVFKSEFDHRKYFLFTGINAGVFFEKKRK